MTKGQELITLNELRIDVSNKNKVSSIIMNTNIEYKDMILSDIQITGFLKNNTFMIDDAVMKINGEII